MTQSALIDDPFQLGPAAFSSRLFVGTGNFSSNQLLKQVIETSGIAMVTVALRRVDFSSTNELTIREAG